MSKKNKKSDLDDVLSDVTGAVVDEGTPEEVETAAFAGANVADDVPAKSEPSNITSLAEKAAMLDAEVQRLRAKMVKLAPKGDIRMLNPKGVIRDIPARMINDCRRKGFLAVDKDGKVLPNDKQPPLISEFAETQMQQQAVKGGKPIVRDLN